MFPGRLALRLNTSLSLLSLAVAIALTAPLAAQEINAPEPRWPVVLAAAPEMTGAGASDPAPQAQGEQGQAEQPHAQQGTASSPTPGAVSAPITQPGAAGEGSTPPTKRDQHRLLKACAPTLTIVNPGEDTTPLTGHEKFRIFYRYSYDPCRIVAAGVSAGINQAEDGFHEYGQGAQGYGKRLGANLADTNLATFFGRFMLPTLLHDDPRYFRVGPTGTFKQRLMHAIISPEWTRRDNGTHRLNYSRILGDLMATSVGNAYYPDNDRGAGITFSRAGTMLGTASGSAAFEEFWPDIKARIFKKHKHEPAQ